MYAMHSDSTATRASVWARVGRSSRVRSTSRAMLGEANARPYGSSAIRTASGSSRPMPRAAATHWAVRLGASSRMAVGQLVYHAAWMLADLVVLALDGDVAVAL